MGKAKSKAKDKVLLAVRPYAQPFLKRPSARDAVLAPTLRHRSRWPIHMLPMVLYEGAHDIGGAPTDAMNAGAGVGAIPTARQPT
eukprot:15620-Amphidinium_carterae.1